MAGTTMWSGHQTIDPQELESRFSNENSMALLDPIFEEPTEEALNKIRKVREILDLLPEREADFVELYYFHSFNQMDIADHFGVSQPTVHYRLRRAAARILFLLTLPDVDLKEMARDLSRILVDDLDVEIMVLMYQIVCQTQVASQLGITQGRVRHRFYRSLDRMEKAGADFAEYVEIFNSVKESLNIRKEVKRPSSGNDYTCILL